MKEFQCKSCKREWFVKADQGDAVVACPFCMTKLPVPRVIIVDSFENAILKVVLDYGINIISDRRKFLSYLTDVAFDFRKEIKILSNACDEKVFSQFFELTTCIRDDALIKIKRIQKHLTDEEGIAEVWATRICKCFIKAIFDDSVEEENSIHINVEPGTTAVLHSSSKNSDSVESSITDNFEEPKLDCTLVQSIYESQIYKTVEAPDFRNWYRKRTSTRKKFYELIIPNKVRCIKEGQFKDNKKFDWLIIGDGLKEIPKHAFQHTSADFVYLSDGVGQIGDYAFADSYVRYVIIKNYENISISDTAFLRCHNVKLVYEHEWNSALTKFCEDNKINHAGIGSLEKYFIEYAKIKLGEKETV